MTKEILLSSPEKGIELLKLSDGGYAVRTFSPVTDRTIHYQRHQSLKSARGEYNCAHAPHFERKSKW